MKPVTGVVILAPPFTRPTLDESIGLVRVSTEPDTTALSHRAASAGNRIFGVAGPVSRTFEASGAKSGQGAGCKTVGSVQALPGLPKEDLHLGAFRFVPIHSKAHGLCRSAREELFRIAFRSSCIDRRSLPTASTERLLEIMRLIKKGRDPMSATHAYMWLLTVPPSGMTVVAVLRCLALITGFKMTFKRAQEADVVPLYREFARALGGRWYRGERDRSLPEAVVTRSHPGQNYRTSRRNPEESERHSKCLQRVGEQRRRLHGSHCERLNCERYCTAVRS
jgi:hypothetical protein